MESALDTFRAQREAVDQVHARLLDVAQLLDQVQSQVDAVASNAEFRAVLRDEQDWLRQAQRLLADVRHFREQEALRYWPGVWRRWLLAVLIAIASAAAAGAGYARISSPYASELIQLRERADLADFIAARMPNMTAAEHRQLVALLRGAPDNDKGGRHGR